MDYPRIYLAIDNCFASKRWTTADQWMSVIQDLGLQYVEASADNELDPLYMGESYIADWIEQVRRASEQTGVKVANLYSGHGTYATLGLGHTDPRVRDRILCQWLMPMRKIASQLGAGLGFYCHAFNQATLQDTDAYHQKCRQLYDQLAELAACEPDGGYVGVEQMYSPHQIPWTIAGTRNLLKEVYARGGSPMYITVDTGHQVGQKRFQRPSRPQITRSLKQAAADAAPPDIWLGPDRAYEIFQNCVAKQDRPVEQAVDEIEQIMDQYPHLFAGEIDTCPYQWLSELACYSPIIHLQQTDGNSSSHWAFTKELNARGIIDGERILRAVCQSFEHDHDQALPPVVDEIYLTLEMFSATADKTTDIISRLRQTVAYWRQYIPRDGEQLDEIVRRFG